MSEIVKRIAIAGRTVGEGAPPFIIAEMSGNHNRDIDRALAIVDAAADAGAHAITLQTYTADTLTLDIDRPEFVIDDAGSLWNRRTLYDLYEEAHTPWEWHRAIFERASARNLICFSTPFDGSAVDFLEKLDAPAYKIASFENTDLPLIRTVAATGKPVILSTGMASLDEIGEAVETIRSAGNDQIALLKCTSAYPADASHANIATIVDIAERYGVVAGVSDHTPGIGVAVAAVALGAAVVEKHFTLRRADGGVDAAFSLEPSELAALVEETDRAWRSVGGVSYGPTAGETASLQFRRSLYVVADMKEGERFTRANLRSIRPGFGAAAKYLDEALGRRAVRDIRRGEPASRDMWGRGAS